MKRIIALMLTMALFMSYGLAQEKGDKKDKDKNGYEFKVVKENPTTPVKNQYRSGTCWSFSGIALLESELLRMGKGEYDLSEMFVVRNAYTDKAEKYIRWHGKINFAGGGGFSDVTMCYQDYGMVPESAYDGLVIGEELHTHGEMDEVFSAYVEAVMKNRNRKLTPVWMSGFECMLDAYLGDYPSSFTYEEVEYTPVSFAEMLGLDMNDYVELTSYTHHPFYTSFILEIPDNWMHSLVYNLPLDELIEVFDYAIDNGYTVAWGADVSDKGFSWKNGVAIVPDVVLEDMSGTEKERWEALTKKEQEERMYSFDGPGPEKEVTQQMRQEAFDNYETTDDHGMLITGKAKDQEGNMYYIVKNSWGTTGNDYEGYLHASVPYVRYKTMSIMVNKNAIPESLREKLGL
jgi:bleomycin hydrolase